MANAEVCIFIAVTCDDLLYWLQVFIFARGIDLSLDVNVRNSGALALASEYGRCIERSGRPSALLGSHGWRSLGVS
jgi:hypothetical protein